MIWLAWRRQRLQFIVVAAALVGLAIWMVITRHVADSAAAFNAAHLCDSFSTASEFNCVQHNLPTGQENIISLILYATPCLMGLLVGAPLVASEFRQHTNRLAWTQGISRTKWLAIKVAMALVALGVVSVLFQIVVQWWVSDPNTLTFGNDVLAIGPATTSGVHRIDPRIFDVTGIVPTIYVLFAFSLGVSLGAIVRRISLAVVGTVVVYVFVTVMMVTVIRPAIITPVFVPDAVTGGIGLSGSSGSVSTQLSGIEDGAWELGYAYRLAPGLSRPIGASSIDAVINLCSSPEAANEAYPQCLLDHGVQSGQNFQPASRYWPLQLIEGGIYLLATLALLVAALVSVRRWRA